MVGTLATVHVDESTDAAALQQRLTLLAEAGRRLGATLDPEAALLELTRLVVPLLADWCSADLAGEDGAVRGVGGTHADPAVAPALLELQRRFPPAPDGGQPVAVALRTLEPVFYPSVDPALLVASSRGAEHVALRQAVGFASVIVVPLLARGRLLGAVTFARGSAQDSFTQADYALAVELGQRAALAADNARLYREAQEQAHAQTVLNAALREMAAARDKALADAREALHLREQFLATAAHELRTPMTSLRGYAQLLHRQLAGGRATDPVRASRALRLIDLQSLRLARLVRQLIDLSRAEVETLALNLEDAELTGLADGVLQEAREMLAVTAPAAAVRHSFALDAPAPVVATIDRERLEHVLAALVENAVKYSPNGGEVSVSVRSAGQDRVRIAVRDHGVGVPPEERDRLFERFFQSAERGAVGGMGLSLYASRLIISRHGGTLAAEFPPDGGTCIALSLPLRPQRQDRPAGAAESGRAGVSSAPQWNAFALE